MMSEWVKAVVDGMEELVKRVSRLLGWDIAAM
jgi:hypothetical protein